MISCHFYRQYMSYFSNLQYHSHKNDIIYCCQGISIILYARISNKIRLFIQCIYQGKKGCQKEKKKIGVGVWGDGSPYLYMYFFDYIISLNDLM